MTELNFTTDDVLATAIAKIVSDRKGWDQDRAIQAGSALWALQQPEIQADPQLAKRIERIYLDATFGQLPFNEVSNDAA